MRRYVKCFAPVFYFVTEHFEHYEISAEGSPCEMNVCLHEVSPSVKTQARQ